MSELVGDRFGSGRNAPTWRRTRSVSGSRMCGIENSACPHNSWASTHSRISSIGISHEPANASIVWPTSTTSRWSRGIGRSCNPNARWASLPTIEPTAIPSIAGASILLMPAIICAIGSLTGVSDLAGAPSEVASSVNSGRYASSVSCVHCPGVSSFGSGKSTGEPITSLTWSPAIRASSAYASRIAGSTLCSVFPPVAPRWANCRAASQLSGP